MLYHAILADARAISSQSLATPLSPADWKRTLNSRRRQWRQMLGIDPLPERTPMAATVTGTRYLVQDGETPRLEV